VPVLTPILLYHDVVRGTPTNPWQVGVDDLARDLDAVVASGRVVQTASDLDGALRGRPVDAVPRCAVTFDDGYGSFVDLVLPLLADRGLPVTLYVTTGMLDTAGMLSAAAVRDLAGAQLEIGAHSVHHPHLDLLTDTAAQAEVRGSRDRLADLLGVEPPGFAYPHGSFHRSLRDIVRDCGFTNAYAVKNALSHPDDDPYARARLTVLADTGRSRVQRWLAGRAAPRSWRRERLRTTAYRQVRAARMRLS
jgi:peptidoglycan/xylan/chitin deacetylase (PgdA/CDA1 family)